MTTKTNKDFSFTFNTLACVKCNGNCCIGASGYIWINTTEIEALAKLLNISQYDLILNKLIKVNGRYSIKENKLNANNYACVFFDLVKKQCKIYDARPSQCKSFPFWDYYNKTNTKIDKDSDKLKELTKECIGITLK